MVGRQPPQPRRLFGIIRGREWETLPPLCYNEIQHLQFLKQKQNHNKFTDAVGTENCFMIINLKLFLDNNYVKAKIYLFEFGKKYSCFHKGKANEKTECRNKSKTFLRWKMTKTKFFLALLLLLS